ncbi:ABC transporter ATP-binding protein [Pontibacter silvestris]|nr:ABC transporter ATP-binding protein [Pontibacter silvestris]MCC9136568.1 ABC transporter ATP-binding protein [Pontibacter silvestris]
MILAFLLLLPLTTVLAQTEEPFDGPDEINTAHSHVIKIHPLRIGEITASYEKQRTSRVTNEFGMSYIYKSYTRDVWAPKGENVFGVGMFSSQRHYTSKKHDTPFGFYHGPVFGYRFIKFEEGVFDLSEDAPDRRYVGRLYQNAMDLSYQVGGQFQMGNHLTMEISGLLGGRVKYAYSKGARELITNNIIGYVLTSDESSAVMITPLPQLVLSVGYSF